MKNFRFEEAIYCAATEPFIRQKDFNQYYIRSQSSEDFGEQSIYGLKEKISLDNPIGAMGNSGSVVKSGGLHVHFELWNNGMAINPIPFIKNLKLVDTNTLVSK